MPSTTIRGFLVPGIIISVVATSMVVYGLEYIPGFNILITTGNANANSGFQFSLAIATTIIGVIMLAIGLFLLAKGLLIWKSFHKKAAAERMDEQRYPAPKRCMLCGGFIVNWRCSSCRAAWCSKCGTWSTPGAMNCSTCHHLLPP